LGTEIALEFVARRLIFRLETKVTVKTITRFRWLGFRFVWEWGTEIVFDFATRLILSWFFIEFEFTATKIFI
jgi:hypothetical protein